MTTTQPDTAAQVTALARDYRRLQAEKDLIDEQQDNIKTRVRDLLHIGDKLDVDGKTVSLTANRRFDPNLAQTLLPPELLQMCYVTKVDPAAARKALPPAIYDSCMAEAGAARVVLG